MFALPDTGAPGLDRALPEALSPWPFEVHDPGKIILDLAVACQTLEFIAETAAQDARFVRDLVVERHGEAIIPALRFYRAWLAFSMADPANGNKINFPAMNAEWSKRFGTPTQPNKPARSTVQVGLATPGALVEIEFVAVKKQ